MFASDRPIRQVDLARRAHARAKDLVPILAELRKDYEARHPARQVAGGWVFRTSARFAPFVRDRPRQTRASPAPRSRRWRSSPTASPSRGRDRRVRGVDSGPVLKLLLERDLVRILGKRDEPGRPLIYGTGAGFLDFFGLKSLKDLPTLQEFTELNEESRIVYEAETGEAPDAFVDPGAGDPEPSDGTYDAGDGDADGDGAAIDDPEAVLDGRASSEDADDDDEDADEDDEDDEGRRGRQRGRMRTTRTTGRRRVPDASRASDVVPKPTKAPWRPRRGRSFSIWRMARHGRGGSRYGRSAPRAPSPWGRRRARRSGTGQNQGVGPVSTATMTGALAAASSDMAMASVVDERTSPSGGAVYPAQVASHWGSAMWRLPRKKPQVRPTDAGPRSRTAGVSLYLSAPSRKPIVPTFAAIVAPR